MTLPPDPEDIKSLETAHDFVEQARGLLDEPEPALVEGANLLRNAMGALGTRSTTQAWEIRHNASQLWMRIAIQEPDLLQAIALLREGIEKFGGLPAAINFGVMRQQAIQTLEAEEVLLINAGYTWPRWFEEPDGRARLAELVTSIYELLESEIWPILQKKVNNLHSKLVLYVQQFIIYLADLAHQQARANEFAQGRQTILNIYEIVSDPLKAEVASILPAVELEQLSAALDSRQRAEVALWSAFSRLVNQNIPFKTVLAELDLELPEHPDVHINDLKSLYSDITKGAAAEIYLQTLFSPHFFTLKISEWQELQALQFGIQETIPPFLTSTDTRLGGKIRGHFSQFSNAINSIPDEIIRQLEQALEHTIFDEEDTAAQRLVNRFWRAKWALEMQIIHVQSLVERAEKAFEQTPTWLYTQFHETAAHFLEIKNLDQLDVCFSALKTLQSINYGLISFPGKHAANISLPEALVMAEMQSILPELPLNAWGAIIQAWKKQVNAFSEQKSSQSTPSTADSLTKIIESTQNLKDEIWPDLELPPWEETAMPVGLITTAVPLIDAFTQAENVLSGLSTDQPLQTAITLDEFQALPAFEAIAATSNWLINPIREYLLLQIDLAYQNAIVKIQSDIAGVLSASQNVDEKLQITIFSQAQTPETARVIIQAIENEIAKIEQKEGALAAEVTWEIIDTACTAWLRENKNTPGFSETGRVWKNFQNKATKSRRQSWLKRHQRLLRMISIGIVGFGVIGILLAGFGVFGNTPFFTASRTTPDVQITSTLSVGKTTPTGAPATLAPSAAPTLNLAATEQAASTQTAVVVQAAATGTAQAALIAQETAEADANYCLENPAGYQFEILGEPKLSPERGAYYVDATTPFLITATWEIHNIGTCDWEQITLQTPTNLPVMPAITILHGNGSIVSPDQPVINGETIKIAISLSVQDYPTLTANTWPILINTLPVTEPTGLSFNPDGWILMVTPPPFRP